ncbi:hypothetical protein [uncultured Dechloromonas sp.]|uniref:hypothetical protein n=1 Tax=uncultured Dechloromonas sp. TaxID=171719 RepID=UPI0025D49644|nr:hypothetical protein [uncultured Dechloromonas sp.]
MKMNTRPIETAQDPDLRLSVHAIERAARRAREIARQTATALVISHNGVIELLQPEQLVQTPPSAQEQTAPYAAK